MVEQFPSLPWWIIVYLALIFGFTVASASRGLKRSVPGIVLSIISFCFITIFVIGFFHRPLIENLDWLILPMTVLGIGWEFYLAVTETGRAEEELKTDLDLSDEERKFLINFAVFINAVLVVPGYALGIKFCMYYLGLDPPVVE